MTYRCFIARALYNGIRHRFKHSCFLHNVRENSNKYGLVHLQNMLLSEIVRKKDIQLGNSSEGVSMIKHRLHQHQVLLILDDVDSLEQLEALVGEPDWFGPGSRVIIITRNRNLLAHHKVERIYLVEELNRTHARKLLSHKVFKHGIVNPSYTDILDQIVTYASGLPLALEHLGSYLFGKSVDEWRYALDRFKRIPYYDIPRILKANIDALEKAEQSIFQEALHSVSEVSQTSQSILQVSHASMKVVGVSSHSSESVFEVSLTSQCVFEDSQTSQSVREVLQTIRVMLLTSRVFQAEEMCRLVGLVSSVVGLSCHALSPSFKRLIRGWNPFKFFLYGVLSLVICASVLFAKSSSFSIKHKNYTCFAVFMIISVYSFLYDKAVDGKPELLSLASNVASALASLSLSKLVKFGFETGTFCYFLGCFTIQLLTIDWKLILVAIIVDFPLFVMHLSSDSQPKDGHGCQTIPLWTPNN